MIVLTGKNSLAELFSISKDRLNLFDEVANKLNLVYRIRFEAFSPENVNVFIKFRDYAPRVRTHCAYTLNKKNFDLTSELNSNKAITELKETINDESNKSKLDEILEYLRYKMSVISDYLKFEKDLKIKYLELKYSGFFGYESACHNNINIVLKEKDNDYTIQLTNKPSKYEISFNNCNIKDIKHILDNYKMRENTIVFVRNCVFINKKPIYRSNSNLAELREKILEYADDGFSIERKGRSW